MTSGTLSGQGFGRYEQGLRPVTTGRTSGRGGFAATVLLALALGLAGCSSDDDGSDLEPTADASAGDAAGDVTGADGSDATSGSDTTGTDTASDTADDLGSDLGTDLGGEDAGDDDTGSADVDAGGPDVGPAPELAINISAPDGQGLLFGTVSIVVESTGDEPEQMVIAVDGTTIATLTGAPWTVEWDTSAGTDGPRTITATASAAGADDEVASVAVIVDNADPVSIQHQPAIGATGVSLKTPIRLDMSEPIANAEAVSFVVTDGDGNTIPSTTAASDDARSFTITLTAKPFGDVTLTATPSEPLQDAAGNSWEWDDAWEWEVPAFLVTAGPVSEWNTTAYPADLVLGADGEPLVLWETEDDEGEGINNLSRFSSDPGGSGSGTWELVGGAALSFEGYSGKLFVEAGGTLLLAMEGAGPSGEIVVQRYDGVGWAPVGDPVSAPQPVGSTSIEMLSGPGGATYLVWRESLVNGQALSTWVAELTESGWSLIGSELQAHTANGTSVYGISPAVDATGRLHLAWTEAAAFGQSASGVVQRRDGETWSTLAGDLDVIDGASFVNQISLAIDPSTDTPVVAFSEQAEDNSERLIYVRGVNDQADFGSGISGPAGYAEDLHFFIDDGQFTLGWAEEAEIYASRRVEGEWLPLMAYGLGEQVATLLGLESPYYVEDVIFVNGPDGLVILWAQGTDENPYSLWMARENSL